MPLVVTCATRPLDSGSPGDRGTETGARLDLLTAWFAVVYPGQRRERPRRPCYHDDQVTARCRHLCVSFPRA
jgi:hypothetical protein